MSVIVQLTVASQTEAMRIVDLAPHLKTWRGMKRKPDDERTWTFEGATVTLAYEGRVGGAGLVNTIRIHAAKPTEAALGRLWNLADWLRAELGWQLTDTTG